MLDPFSADSLKSLVHGVVSSRLLTHMMQLVRLEVLTAVGQLALARTRVTLEAIQAMLQAGILAAVWLEPEGILVAGMLRRSGRR